MEEKKRTAVSRLPMLGSANKKAKTEATAAPTTKRNASTSSLRGLSSSAGKAQPGITRQTSASGKALFTVGTKSAAAGQNPSRAPLRTTRSAKPPSNTTAKQQTVTAKPKASTDNKTATTKTGAAKPKRAAWDTKGQLEDLRAEVAEMKNYYQQSLEDKENQKQQIVEEKTQEISSVESRLTTQLADIKAQYEQAREDFTRDSERLKKDLDASNKSVVSLNDQIEQLTQELRISRKEAAMLKLTEKENKFELESNNQTIQKLTERCESVEAELSCNLKRNSELEENKRQHETERRRLHNTIQELKGNIRVFCRVRPTLKMDGDQRHEVFSYPDLDSKKVALTRPSNLNESAMNDTLKKTERLDFSFDKVFESESSQAQVFEEISQLVQSALDGYNVCIFAYGQTGSGKTYTMQGPEVMSRETEGMIPRSIEQIFESASELAAIGWKYKMEASFLEIYNEQVRDLLAETNKDKTHEIKSGSGEIIVTNIALVTVTQPRQVESLFEKATKNRAVAETQCNSRSSRSHSVFTLKISGTNELTSESCQGTLNLVDLAGSERLKDSKSAGDRLKETQCINASLSALGNVIMSLASKKSHIPYRDSKLTYLLQNSLGGNSKTLMFVNVSPNEEHFNESVNSLRFATKVNNCSIGTAKKVAK